MIPTDTDILAALDRLTSATADDIEGQHLEFKPWIGPKEDLRVAVEYAVAFANAQGGAIVFGVADRTRGRAHAIHGSGTCDLDVWRRGIFDSTTPGIVAQVSELPVPEGTGRLLVVRVERGTDPPYGTSQGMFKIRVGKNSMPLDPSSFRRTQVSTGAIDWSAQLSKGATRSDLDPLEIERARSLLRRAQPGSDLLRLDDDAFLVALGVLRAGAVTNTGLLLVGRRETLAEHCPQHQVHYVYQPTDTDVARNDSWKDGLLAILERIEAIFTGPSNPEHELTVGFVKLRVPSFPIGVVREAVLNAVTHRDYSDPGEVLVRQRAAELVITSPGGFLAGITPSNILRCEPVSRNRHLAEAFEKLRLVERAGIGRNRIYAPLLSYGKRSPRYETDGSRVILRIYDGTFDERMAVLVARWNADGHEIGLDALLVLAHLREHAFIDTTNAASLLQLDDDAALGVLERLSQPKTGILERMGRTRTATFHLTKGVAKDLLGKAAYTKTRGLDPLRYGELVRRFVEDHGAITPKECRELLGLGSSRSAMTEVWRLLKSWSEQEGFLDRQGRPPRVRYVVKPAGVTPDVTPKGNR
jgi:ATP-dependent DNA helicase RecG